VMRHIASRTHQLFDGAERAGIPLAAPRERLAGSVTVRPSDVRAASRRLNDAKVIHSLREGTIRLSPHCYTTEAEIDLALTTLVA
jgi:cysteine desulfurase/selenocysteine lyase